MNKTRKQAFDDEQAMISELEAGGYESISNEKAEIERLTEIFSMLHCLLGYDDNPLGAYVPRLVRGIQ